MHWFTEGNCSLSEYKLLLERFYKEMQCLRPSAVSEGQIGGLLILGADPGKLPIR